MSPCLLRSYKRIQTVLYLPREYCAGHLEISATAENIEPVCKCITAGFFANAAKLHADGGYRTVRDDHPLYIHPTSVLYSEQPPKWVVFNEVVQTTKDFMRDVTVINPDWLCELAPDFYQFGTEREIAEKRIKLDETR